MGGKVCSRWKGKTLMGVVNKLLKTKSLLTSLSNVLPYQVNFPTNNFNFHWRWRWWDWIQAIFLNLFYFTHLFIQNFSPFGHPIRIYHSNNLFVHENYFELATICCINESFLAWKTLIGSQKRNKWVVGLINTVFSRIVSADSILFWGWKMCFRIMAIF